MPVRNTESRIPVGLSLEDLGQAVEKGDFKLVSYLTQPLRYEENKKPIANTYVLFDTSKTSEPSDYRWKFEFKVEGETNVIELSDLKGIEVGAVFNLNSENSVFKDALEGKKVKKITTTVALDANATTELVLEQTVEGLDEDIEELIVSSEFEMGAIAGDPKTTRILANDYRAYLLELEKNKGEVEIKKISINLISTLLYQAIENNDGAMNNPDEEKWLNYVNSLDDVNRVGGISLDDLIGSKMGGLNVKPHIFHFFTKNLAEGESLENFVFDKAITSNIDKYEKDLLSKITDSNELKDLVNILRFPKSSINASWKYLKNLKERHAAIKDNILDIENHPDNKKCVSTVVTEHETVPHKNDLDEFSSTSEQAFDIMYTEWMQAILFTSKILMATLNLKVLDVRSGKGLIDEKVRKIVVAGTKGGSFDSFTYTDEVDNASLNDSAKKKLREYFRNCSVIPNGVHALEAAQRALFRMGYAPDKSYKIDSGNAQKNTYKKLENKWSA